MYYAAAHHTFPLKSVMPFLRVSSNLGISFANGFDASISRSMGSSSSPWPRTERRSNNEPRACG